MSRSIRQPPTPAEQLRVWELTKLIDETNDSETFERALAELYELSDRLYPVKGYGLETLDREVVVAVQDQDRCYRIQNELLCNGVITTKVEGNFELCLMAHPDTTASRLVELVLRELDAPNDATL